MTLHPVVRACSEKELRYLRRQRSTFQQRRNTLWRRALATYFGVFGVLAAFTLWAEGTHPGFILGFWAVLGGLISLSVFIQEWRRLSVRTKAYEGAIASATAEDLVISARRFWEFEEQEDEGACYAFELVTGGVVFISGQDFYPDARFPTVDFSIVQFRDGRGCVLDMMVETRRPKTTPDRLISAEEKADLDLPEHAALFPGTLEHVLAQLKKDLAQLKGTDT